MDPVLGHVINTAQREVPCVMRDGKIIFMTHLFNARKASLANRVPSLCGIDNPSGAC
jgi:hypothetical protein